MIRIRFLFMEPSDLVLKNGTLTLIRSLIPGPQDMLRVCVGGSLGTSVIVTCKDKWFNTARVVHGTLVLGNVSSCSMGQ